MTPNYPSGHGLHSRRGTSCSVLTADLADAVQARQAIEDAVECFARLDVLVNNAGYVAMAPSRKAIPRTGNGWSISISTPSYTCRRRRCPTCSARQQTARAGSLIS
ncbi:SDR family NAD(P)-dependent oxidoreductase [Streptomyces chiangmaiensis]|uniref:SDR family NAD(P)-dependent oxidoreductase n=1 Tax=Streptomyces chiangmaiensis TaxID=766497 RepID=A0ABU7FQY7_9ACTN|nr:SDR family NAD(P)-dependent oxidoreductase [Streptomyces chiangmaiensis]MED7826238.1 SDR family NAD(P)-dependent oxidoreductase [Streptomyces chiangmaiensis]